MLFNEFGRDVWPVHAATMQRLVLAHGGQYLTGDKVRIIVGL